MARRRSAALMESLYKHQHRPKVQRPRDNVSRGSSRASSPDLHSHNGHRGDKRAFQSTHVDHDLAWKEIPYDERKDGGYDRRRSFSRSPDRTPERSPNRTPSKPPLARSPNRGPSVPHLPRIGGARNPRAHGAEDAAHEAAVSNLGGDDDDDLVVGLYDYVGAAGGEDCPITEISRKHRSNVLHDDHPHHGDRIHEFKPPKPLRKAGSLAMEQLLKGGPDMSTPHPTPRPMLGKIGKSATEAPHMTGSARRMPPKLGEGGRGFSMSFKIGQDESVWQEVKPDLKPVCMDEEKKEEEEKVYRRRRLSSRAKKAFSSTHLHGAAWDVIPNKRNDSDDDTAARDAKEAARRRRRSSASSVVSQTTSVSSVGDPHPFTHTHVDRAWEPIPSEHVSMVTMRDDAHEKEMREKMRQRRRGSNQLSHIHYRDIDLEGPQDNGTPRLMETPR
eukprot:CAMPEP_0118867840 /NCGR_PEP_ID=MMETSP1163-20130328/11265_1 /TAXON_ID=124430 /ORGANISM="Phaeomonas parva, Strain CCMP2877" /LENGTH=443 /DNA_ID=CAMNT_0006802311 /DNA_START=248 /DNA_END=1575 /DNA_ORIENTATION=+